MEHAGRLVDDVEGVGGAVVLDPAAVDEEADGGRHHEEQRRPLVLPQDLDGDERHGRHGDRTGEAEREDLAQPLHLGLAAGEEDGEGDGRVADQGHDDGGEEGAAPADRADRAARLALHDLVEGHGGEDAGQEVVADVERELLGRLAAGSHEGPGRPEEQAEEQLRGGGEEQAEDEGELVEREELALAAVAHPDRVGLGEEEPDRQRPPGEVERCLEGDDPLGRVQVQRDGEDHHPDAQDPDAGDPGHGQPRDAAADLCDLGTQHLHLRLVGPTTVPL